MVRQQRSINHLKKGEHIREHEDLVVVWSSSGGCMKRSKPKLLSLLLFSLLCFCFCFVFSPHLFSICFSVLDSSDTQSESFDASQDTDPPTPSTVSNESMWCDRSGFRSDICFMEGGIRTHSHSSSIFLYASQERPNGVTNHVLKNTGEEDRQFLLEKIKPYTRKWETSIMDTIRELDLVRRDVKFGEAHTCDVQHDVPAVVFSTGGYTGNVYHEFNDGIVPLYITSQHFRKRVVFVILEYHSWWEMKYREVLSQLSDYPLIDFGRDRRTHCFTEAIVGLKIHGELTVDPSLMQENKTIIDFRNLLDRAYRPRINTLIREEELRSSTKAAKKEQAATADRLQKPKLVLLSRKGSRGITNEDSLVKMAKRIGFQVHVLRPDRKTELSKIYEVLSSSNILVGVHGAAMTHFLFMRPGSLFIQIIPLGTDWAAETYYGEPARKLGLEYIGYQIRPRESSLYDKYDKEDPVLRDPSSITKKGWQFTKNIYLDDQNVRLDLRRFKKVLAVAYAKSIS